VSGATLQERDLPGAGGRRRVVLLLGAACLAAGGRRLGAQAPPAPSPWQVAEASALVLRPGDAIDLAASLPPTVRPGGVFEVDPAGAPLPDGVALAANGILTVGPIGCCTAGGVVFLYTPPD
jgi:hypothetical protein